MTPRQPRGEAEARGGLQGGMFSITWGIPPPHPGSERPQVPRGIPWKPTRGTGAGTAARPSLFRELRAEFPAGHRLSWNFCSSRCFAQRQSETETK